MCISVSLLRNCGFICRKACSKSFNFCVRLFNQCPALTQKLLYHFGGQSHCHAVVGDPKSCSYQLLSQFLILFHLICVELDDMEEVAIWNQATRSEGVSKRELKHRWATEEIEEVVSTVRIVLPDRRC